MMESSKKRIMDTVDAAKADLQALSENIHKNPELGFQEFKALEFIGATLEKHGFEVQKGYGGLETSFRADKKGNSDIEIIGIACCIVKLYAINQIIRKTFT